jgi:hypothetical protein
MSETRNYGQEIKEAIGDVEKQRDLLQEFVTNVLTEGVDFGLIPGIPTPTLLKPGAEKLIALFGLRRNTYIVGKEVDWDKKITVKNYKGEREVVGFVSYEVKCELKNENDEVVGSGLGAGNTFEKKRAANGDGYDTQNTTLKMTEKRAMVDAALSYSLVSGMFTQDVEDMDLGDRDSAPSRSKASTAANSSISDDAQDWEVTFGLPDFKGKMLSELPDKSVAFYAGAFRKNIKEGKNVAENKKLLSIAQTIAHNRGISI